MSNIDIDQYKIRKEPYYEAVGNEIDLYQAAYNARMPMMLKGRQDAVNHVSWNTWPGSWVARSLPWPVTKI